MVNTAIFEASKTPNRNTFLKIMEERVKPAMPHAYDHFAKVDPRLWTHHASSQTTRVGDQSTTNLVESNMQWLSDDVSMWVCDFRDVIAVAASYGSFGASGFVAFFCLA